MSMDGLALTSEPDLAAEDQDAILSGLRQYNRKHAAAPGWSELFLVLRDSAGQVRGGLVGESGWEWLHVQFLWVADEYRGRGYGRLLLEAAEGEALARGCGSIHLDTHDFQAPAFYQHLGFTTFGVLDDYPPGSQRYFMMKRLAGSGG